MNISEIAFSKHVGISKKSDDCLKLGCTEVVQNHIQSIHASAQYTLAETQTGLYLGLIFPEYAEQIMPLLRSSSVKYKNPATSEIHAIATAKKEDLEKFEAQFLKKGRAGITVSVELRDANNLLTMQGEFNWFVQKI